MVFCFKGKLKNRVLKTGYSERQFWRFSSIAPINFRAVLEGHTFTLYSADAHFKSQPEHRTSLSVNPCDSSVLLGGSQDSRPHLQMCHDRFLPNPLKFAEPVTFFNTT